MAGVKGMHARRSTSPAYVESVRSRIRAGGIAKRLEYHVLGKVEMSATQVAAALGLLKKVVPDQSAIEHSVDPASAQSVQGFAAFVAEATRGSEDADGSGMGAERSVLSPALPVTTH